jgi:hypothetical protein
LMDGPIVSAAGMDDGTRVDQGFVVLTKLY